MVETSSRQKDSTTLDTTEYHVDTAIVGGGIAGLGLAIKLKNQNYDDFVVIERGDDVGGTWRDNTYPGAACDVPSHLYSYSFAPNPDWQRSFSSQSEIFRYIKEVAEHHGIRDKFRFSTEMESAKWNNSLGRWEIRTSRGKIFAKMTVSAVGALCEPEMPCTKGIEEFTGEIFHSSKWNHDCDLAGKRVAVIGTGASAIQIVPAIAPDVARLDLYQRTPPYVFPRLIRSYTALERAAFRRVPWLQRSLRAINYSLREIYAVILIKYPPASVTLFLLARVKLLFEVRDPALRRQVTPTYRGGCKRMLASNTYYPALGRDNVEVVTDGIAEIRDRSIVTNDGRERGVDVIVVATGFRITDNPTMALVTGRDGRTLADVYESEGVAAYKGTAIANFPNMLSILGPNSGLGYSSAIYMIEAQIDYIADAIATVNRDGLATFEVRRSNQDAYNAELQDKMRDSVWVVGGCTSWFLDENGTNVALWPDFSFRFRRILRRFDVAAYITTKTKAKTSTDGTLDSGVQTIGTVQLSNTSESKHV